MTTSPLTPQRELHSFAIVTAWFSQRVRASVTIFPWPAMFLRARAEAIMIRNGLYSLAAVSIDGMDVEVGGVLILRDGQISGGNSFVFYTGTYECSDGKWTGKMLSQEHTPTARPVAERVQRIVSAATTMKPVPKPMPPSSLASNVSDMMPSCGCWQRPKVDLQRNGIS